MTRHKPTIWLNQHCCRREIQKLWGTSNWLVTPEVAGSNPVVLNTEYNPLSTQFLSNNTCASTVAGADAAGSIDEGGGAVDFQA